ncbi:unnamed protein product [Phytophthora fragariaefolia]|uniref:Unnamed protein product n=1 Tax=Phytophthora fragariaefolia TaxID=1490495 RepID=A0A9W6TX18_9STRA|nr:unnamed protein product [Phytophthora fragariaefolia]
MVKTNTFELRVVLENGNYFSYENPSKNICIEFSECDNWDNAKSVTWRNLPPHWEINFYKARGCVATDGGICVQIRHPVKRAEAATIISNETAPGVGEINTSDSSTIVGSVDEDISSNWFEPMENSSSDENELKMFDLTDI